MGFVIGLMASNSRWHLSSFLEVFLAMWDSPLLPADLPSGKHTTNYGKSPFLMGTLSINGHCQ